MSQYWFVAMVLTSFFTPVAQAATRVIVIPGRSAILIMEGMSSAGADPDPRRLYDSIAMAPIQQSGGEGKIIGFPNKIFNLTCATKNSTQLSVLCNIVVKPSPGSTIEFGHAEFHATGPDAKAANEKLAGKNVRFDFVSSDGAMKIESTPEHFDFIYR
jgi:hypothetical protein